MSTSRIPTIRARSTSTFEVSRSPPAPSRSARASRASRTSSRRRRCSRPTSSATASPSRSRRRSPGSVSRSICACTSRTSSTARTPPRSACTTSSASTTSSPSRRSVARSRSATPSSTPSCARRSPTRSSPTRSPRRRRPRSSAQRARCPAFQNLPLANLFNDGITSSVRPALTYDSRNNRSSRARAPISRARSSWRQHRVRQPERVHPLPRHGPLLLPDHLEHRRQDQRRGRPRQSPTNEGVPIFARFFLGGILDVRGFPLRSIGPRLPLKRSLDENAAPILNGANIGGNLDVQYFQNVEIEFPILDQVGIRGVVFTDLGNVWNLEELYCDAAPASPYSATNPASAPTRLLRRAHLVGLRHPLVLAARPAALRVGLPVLAAALRREQRVRVHHRQLLLSERRGAPAAQLEGT
jgi:hypothetical protein